MHTLIQPYLFFAGHCEEAIEFYKQAIGASVSVLMRFHESPDAPPPGTLPPGYENKVMHATVHVNGAVIMMSDGCAENSSFGGFAISLALPTAAAAQQSFDALGVGGQIQMPLGATFWSPCFGMVTDRFGVQWMVSVVEPHP